MARVTIPALYHIAKRLRHAGRLGSNMNLTANYYIRYERYRARIVIRFSRIIGIRL